jgi:N-acetylglutamate synthase-like GNAT family acetyltransferase
MRQALQDEWHIRRATEADSEAIANFLERQHRPKRSDWVISEYFIAEGEGDIVGCVAVRDRERFGYLYGLAVDKSWRRRGIGHALTQHCLDWLCEKGADSAFTLVMFWNIRFVKQHGFELADRHMKRDLGNLHRDFVDKWSARSVLLVADLRKLPVP